MDRFRDGFDRSGKCPRSPHHLTQQDCGTPFPAAADKNAMEFIKSMQDYDLSIKQCPDDHEDIDVEKPEDPEQNDSPNE